MNIEEILPLVQRPGRYINHELHSCHEVKRDAVSVCLCFPDLYEVGISNLGLEILYHLVNERADARAERCYSPAADMEKILREKSAPLFSLETLTPLKAFDIVGITLQFELCATNVVNMLDLAGLPMYSKDRSDIFPLVIGGGPMTANPEPVADFFDAFVVGDGEEAIGDIIECVKEYKTKGADKQTLLRALAKIDGVYVPSLYTVSYNEDGTVGAVTPVSSDIPAAVKKRTVKVANAYFPSKKIVPYLQAVHDRLNIEVARGCPSQCRFCQATKYYFPWRPRPMDKVLQLADDGLKATGFEEVAFSSLSCTDYKDLDLLLTEFHRRHGAQKINVSLPSLKCSQFSLAVAGNLGLNKRPTLTFAPEAGTERLRAYIGKDLSESEIRATLIRAWQSGWNVIKLYFMIGLPTETPADIDGIITLVRSIKKSAQGLNFTVTVSPYVPKAQTPFQWVAMHQPDDLKEKLRYLQKALPASVKSHFVESSILEGVLARGDRRLSRTIVTAWQKGCRFDQWRENLQMDKWYAAFKETGVEPHFYLYRERSAQEVLPWEHIVLGMDKPGLWKQFQAAALAVEALQSSGDAVAEQKPEVNIPALKVPNARSVVPVAARMRLRFERTGIVRFVSHLEQIEAFRRAVRRAELPLVYSGGFSPKPKIAFGPAVSVGHESVSEFLEVELARRMEPAEIVERVNAVLPPGFHLASVKKVPVFFPSFDSLVNVSDYTIRRGVGTQADGWGADIGKKIEALLACPEIIIEKKKEDKIQKIDAKPLIITLSAENETLILRIRFGPKKNVKPEKIVQALTGMTDDELKLLRIVRTALWIEKKDGSLTEP
ncbi:MAG: TIGR03960 family B12-binding radical SAM protein [Elusimicrobia bacterium]|nr:TIGR03960 family B12-binding radical SAM protein [Elusimicrobiota bacterium]